MTIRLRSVLVVGLIAGSVMVAAPANATPFSLIRVGDVDGFGFNPATDPQCSVHPCPAAGPGNADTNGNGKLEAGEFLPDLNNDGVLATNQGDDFDNRSAAEAGNTGPLGGSGFANTGTAGFKWTDVSLSTSYGTPAGNPDGTPLGPFPDPGGPINPNEPLFQFRFDVAKTDIIAGSSLFFNMIFGDYDVSPANVLVTKNGGATSTIGLTLQPGNADGLIQAAFLGLNFFDVFSDGGAVWNGFLDVRFIAPNEPYTTFDYVELSLDQIPLQGAPAPGALALVGLGLAGFGALRRRRAA